MTDTASNATGLPGAAAQFEALLAGGDPDLQTPELSEAPKAPARPAEAFEGEVEGEETASEPADEADAEVAPEDDAATAEDNAESAEPEVQLVTVKIDGKTEQIPLEEAVKGYQRQVDYSRKTQALAEERKTLESERQRVVEERSQYANLLTALQEQLTQLQPKEPDWEKLYEQDPVEWVRQREVWRDRQEKLAAAQFELQRVQVLSAQERQAQLAQVVQQGRQQLTELVPSWKDASKWESDRVRMLEYGQKIGFAPEELQQAYDPRAVVALYKAMKYDDLMAKRPQPAPPRGPRTAPAGSAASAPRPTSDLTRAKQRLAKTGHVRDAASIFEGLLD